jgi:hypothetical protein
MKGYIEVSSRKGGVGTTTTACAIALALENMGNTVLLLDTTGTDSVSAVLGINGLMSSVPEWKGITVKNVHIEGKEVSPYGDYDYVVIDAGNKMFNYTDETATVKRVGVVRNEYLTVKLNMYLPVDVFVCFTIEGNALLAKDVHQVIGSKTPIVDALVSPQVARAIDAGLFTSRWEATAGEWSNAIVASFMAVTP